MRASERVAWTWCRALCSVYDVRVGCRTVGVEHCTCAVSIHIHFALPLLCVIRNCVSVGWLFRCTFFPLSCWCVSNVFLFILFFSSFRRRRRRRTLASHAKCTFNRNVLHTSHPKPIIQCMNAIAIQFGAPFTKLKFSMRTQQNREQKNY